MPKFTLDVTEEKNIWQDIYRRVSQGKECAPRGKRIIEVENFTYELPPYVRFTSFTDRKFNLDYVKKEFQWYLRGDPYDLTICNHAAIWNYIHLRGRLNSNYGLAVFRKGGLDWCAEELLRDPDSRRAAITILDHTHLIAETKDVPCTAYMSFRIREGKLNMSVRMRSQDIIFGMSNDAPAFSFIHEMLLMKLQHATGKDWDLELGTYHHIADSGHVYDYHYEMLEKLIKPQSEFIPIEVPRMLPPEPNYMTRENWCKSHPFSQWLIT